MAVDDIQIHSAPAGGPWILHFPMEAAQVFGKGEVVSADQDGQVSIGADEMAGEDLLGIAMAGNAATAGTALARLNPRTNAAYADGDLFPVCIPTPSTLFITKNSTSGGTAFDDVVPTAALIGLLGSIALVGTQSFGIDFGPTAGSETCRIVDVLNRNKRPITETGETLTLWSAGLATSGSWIVFTIPTHQFAATAVQLVQATG
jgi:hypothetical protein